MLERLRRAVAPDFEVERELASGGMGTVFLGRDVALERPVAIKVLRPDRATAASTERFLREARTLASLNHPDIVAVHRAGESEGLCWYVMDFLAAETLADRLVRGPLPVAGAVATALGVLAALETAHRHGVVHRDVKPANVFLLEGRAVLSDFGVASSGSGAAEPLTIPGRPIGTPDYMAPEQMVGRPTSPATDLCGVGLLLFEALTGERFESWESPDRADWSRVPRRLVPVLRRALALDPAARWQDAAAFAHAIRRARRPARARRILWTASALSFAAAGVAWWIITHRPPSPPAAPRDLVIRPFRVTGPGAPSWLGDSLALALVAALGANTDFRVRVATSADDTAGGQVLNGEATVRGESLDVAVAPARTVAGLYGIRADTAGTLAGWGRAAAALSYQVLLQLWTRRDGAETVDLPLGAAPRTGAGLRAFLDAERLFAHAQWDSAYHAYVRAGALDPTCLICDVRAVDVSRWLGMPRDTVRTHRYRAALDSFPPQYRLLLRASFEPPVERLATLRRLTEEYRDWGFGWFLLGDEIFHRGPLVGLRRVGALAPLVHASLLRPDFAPIWEHLAWEAIEVGRDSALALGALLHYDSLASTGDAAAGTIRALLWTGYMWRFRPEPMAAAFTDGLLRDPRIAGYPHLGAGATYLLSFEVPRAAVWLGERFAQGQPQVGLEERGLLAQVLGLVALGRVDSALAVARRVAARAAGPGVALFAAELPAALALADSADAALAWPALAPPLERFASGAVPASPHERARAAWMLALLAARAQRGADAARYRRVIDAAGPEAAPLAAFVTVVLRAAGHGFAGTALRLSAPLEALDSANGGGDAFYRLLLHLLRAGWQVQVGQPELSVRELRWHENNDFVGLPGPGAPPQGAEVDYAFATLARWHRARLLRTLGSDYRDEACDVLGDVARVWREGEPRYAARADSARTQLAQLRCGATP